MAEGAVNRSSWVTPVLVIGGAFLAYRYIIQPKVVMPLEKKAYLQRVRISLPVVKLRGENVVFDIRIQNPNPKPMTVNALVGNVHVRSNNGKTDFNLGQVAKYGPIVIAPFAQTTASFNIELKLLPMIAYFSSLVEGKIHGQLLTFDGTLSIDGRPYPVNTKYRIA